MKRTTEELKRLAADVIKLNTPDLKALAGSACIGIYDDFDSAEIAQQPRSVQLAWSYGRMLRCENTDIIIV